MRFTKIKRFIAIGYWYLITLITVATSLTNFLDRLRQSKTFHIYLYYVHIYMAV